MRSWPAFRATAHLSASGAVVQVVTRLAPIAWAGVFTLSCGAPGCTPTQRVVFVETPVPCPSQRPPTPKAPPAPVTTQSCGELALERAAFSARGLGPKHPRRAEVEAALTGCEDPRPTADECTSALREEQVLAVRYGPKHPELLAARARAALCRAPSAAVVTALSFAFDGARVGESVASFMRRQGLGASLCDSDPIQGGKRRIWFFAPCKKGARLPKDAMLMLFSSPPSQPDQANVDAVAWAFGDLPAIEFPVRVGSSQADVEGALGPGSQLFDFDGIVDGGGEIRVFAHGPEVYSIIRVGASMGFVVGKMGRERQREEWRGLIANLLSAERRAAKRR